MARELFVRFHLDGKRVLITDSWVVEDNYYLTFRAYPSRTLSTLA